MYFHKKVYDKSQGMTIPFAQNNSVRIKFSNKFCLGKTYDNKICEMQLFIVKCIIFFEVKSVSDLLLFMGYKK